MISRTRITWIAVAFVVFLFGLIEGHFAASGFAQTVNNSDAGSVAVTSTSNAVAARVVDLPTRASVRQRLLVLSAPSAKATVLLFAGGHGGLQIQDNGAFTWGAGNFLIRSRHRFLAQGLNVVIVDTPSDRQSPPFLGGFRQTDAHVSDVKAIIAWARSEFKQPVALVGTSRGTQSAAYVATQLDKVDGPDALILTASILSDRNSRAVPMMALDRINVPVLVVHHEQDECRVCLFSDMNLLMSRLDAGRVKLLTFRGGENVGDPCEARAFHGFNGIEGEVVRGIGGWLVGLGR